MNSFAENLNYLIRKHPDSISNIAQNANLSRPSLYDLMNGKTLPKSRTFTQLCTALSLPIISVQKLERMIKSEKVKFSRKEQQNFITQKKSLFDEVSALLFSMGHEISSSNDQLNIDLVLRLKSGRLPIKISPSLNEPQTILGSLLTGMYHLSAKRGYVCISKVKNYEKSLNSLFSYYGIRIVSPKALIKDLSQNK
jgi:predicted transcriptional regulator